MRLITNAVEVILILPCTGWRHPRSGGACLVQIGIVDSEFVHKALYSLNVGNALIFSCRFVGVSSWNQPTDEQVRAGQRHTMVPLADVWQHPGEWRSCDWITLVMLRPEIEALL